MPFIFGTYESIPPGTDVRRVPAGLESKQSLLKALDEILGLPDYFGQNWDALEECLLDLRWMPPGPLALLHEDLPLRKDSKALAIYLEVLSDAVERWKMDGSRAFLVVFPPASKSAVSALLGQGVD
jgi:RNAse (barnase) inhibitor barstar